MNNTVIIQEPQFIIGNDISFRGILPEIKKSQSSLSPVFEAFTNAIEAIKIKKDVDKSFKGEIILSIHSTELTDSNYQFSKLTIRDDGVGFNEKEFKRFNTFKDISKGFKNLGSGRIQFLHFFDKTIITSVFKEGNSFYQREFVVSKAKEFLDKNAIVKLRYSKPAYSGDTFTEVSFTGLLEPNSSYNILDGELLKKELLRRYLHYFCYHINDLPHIIVQHFVQGDLKSTSTIAKSDIPQPDKEKVVEIAYSRPAHNAKGYKKTDKTEEFALTTFKVTKDLLDNNDLKLISKGEVVEDSKINLTGLSKTDTIGGNKYLVLVSSSYIDKRDTNVRGELEIPSITSTKALSAFESEVIFLEDIETSVNSELVRLYPEIEEISQKHEKDLEQLKEMFLITDEEGVDISLNDDDKKILEKFYEAQAKKEAKVDATLKQSIERLKELDTTSKNYEEELQKEINKIVRILPEQNKRTLAHYIARRKLVIELLSKILDKKLHIQNHSTRDKDEALIHNLLFQQKATSTLGSDLWMINEEFIYFKGSSEVKLKDLEIDGKKVFKTEFEQEEERYLKSLGENRLEKRPDILLFPEEQKCIIIEFKAPKVNASDHLTQINNYASFIRNYTTDDFQIKIFYGYLIGEGIEPRDVQGSVSTFEHSHNFDYLFSPAQKVIGYDGKENGSIYTEVLKYSSLLERAKLRNKIFIEKLGI